MTPFHLNYKLAITTGEHLLKSRDFEAAISMLQNAVGMAHENTKDLSRAKRALGEAYRMTGNINSAQRELDEALRLVRGNELLVNEAGSTLRLLAELAYDKAARLRAGMMQDETLVDQVYILLDDATHTIRSNSDIRVDINERVTIQNLQGARYYERGLKKYGLKMMRSSAKWEITPDSAYYVIINSLRLMKYSPIDRLSSFWRILEAIKQTKTATKPSPYTAYRLLALRALVGLKVKL